MRRSVHRFLESVGAEVMPIDQDIEDAAIAAFTRFGKGDDFPQTDSHLA